jgi:hypothetical protein
MEHISHYQTQQAPAPEAARATPGSGLAYRLDFRVRDSTMDLALLLALSIAATRLEGVCVCPESREERGGRREGAATATFVNLTYSALTLRSPPTRCRAGQPTSTKEDQGSSKGQQRRDKQRVCEPPAILQRMGLQGEGRGAGSCVPWRTRTGSACTPPDSHPRTHTCITQPPPQVC